MCSVVVALIEMRCCVFTITVLLIVGASAVAPKLPRKVADEDASYIPSVENDQERAEMTCSACHTTIFELFRAFKKLKKEFDRQPEKLKEYHLLAASSDVCENARLHMGLIRNESDKRITTVYANELEPGVSEKYSLVKGAWVTSFWMQKCHETLDNLEEEFMPIYKKMGKGMTLCPVCEAVGKATTLRDDADL